jgi:hypothetical protein
VVIVPGTAEASGRPVSGESGGGMIRSAVPITAQDGMIFQAGARTAR